MSYIIKPYSYDKAKKLGVIIKPSKQKGKKIDVFSKEDNTKLASIGQIGYLDFPSYIESKGKSYANERRRLYNIRHSKNLNKVGTPGYYASKILW